MQLVLPGWSWYVFKGHGAHSLSSHAFATSEAVPTGHSEHPPSLPNDMSKYRPGAHEIVNTSTPVPTATVGELMSMLLSSSMNEMAPLST